MSVFWCVKFYSYITPHLTDRSTLNVQRSTVNLDELLQNHHKDILAVAGYIEATEAENGMLFDTIFERNLIVHF